MKMTYTMIFCSFFLSTSVQACYLFRYWFCDSNTSESESPPAPKEIRSSTSKLQGNSNSLKAAPNLEPSGNTKLRQSLSVDESQPIVITSPLVDAPSANDYPTNYIDGTSSSVHLKRSPLEERDIFKPDLNCILFDDSVCSITCNQVCLLYNFESTGMCKLDKTCYCTVTGMKHPAMTFDEYKSQSLDDLWFYKFVKSTVSAKVLDQIKKYPSMVSKILDLLRKPLRTGDDVKNRLITAYPEWSLLRDLKSRRPAPINRFIDDQYKLNESGLEKRIKRSVKKYENKIAEQFSTKDYLGDLTNFLDTLNDEDQLKGIFKQVHDTKVQSLVDQVKSYLQNRGFDFSGEDLGSYECDYVDVDYIDNIVAGAITNQFMTSTHFKSSPFPSGNTFESLANSQSSSSDLKEASEIPSKQNSKSKKTANKTQTQEEASFNVDLGSSSSSNLNDASRWELPGFDKRALSGYTGSVDEVWQTKDYYLSYSKWCTGSFKIEWRKGYDDVTIEVWSTGSVDQTWHLDKASIKLSLACTGSLEQSWQLGDVSYTYNKWCTGSIERKWKNNVRDQNELAKYQGYISAWCAANYFLIEKRYCVIF